MLEVITDITTYSGAGKVAVMYFADDADPLASVSAVTAFWDDATAPLVNATKFRVRGSGRRIDEATGEIAGFYNVLAPAEVAGKVTGVQGVSDATQVLMQWRTGVVRAGREVRGRTFVPGLQTPALSGGNLDNNTRSMFVGAQANLLDPGLGFGVWSRPKEGAPGAHIQVAGGSVWNELAVLRRRRG